MEYKRKLESVFIIKRFETYADGAFSLTVVTPLATEAVSSEAAAQDKLGNLA
jgi:hypothetical protein